MGSEKVICWVCCKEKKPYIVLFTNKEIEFEWIDYTIAREDGEICEDCYTYFRITHNFKPATKQDIEIARNGNNFANTMLKYWEFTLKKQDIEMWKKNYVYEEVGYLYEGKNEISLEDKWFITKWYQNKIENNIEKSNEFEKLYKKIHKEYCDDNGKFDWIGTYKIIEWYIKNVKN